jgi:formylglycine-generating enzyme required for sulfatase activity
MHGNVAEWNEEMLTKAETGAPEQVARGGYWPYPAGYGAVNYRIRTAPAYRYNAHGLRVARVP